MPSESTSSFQLPDGQTLEVYALKTTSGRTIVRTKDELEKAPAAPATGADAK